jgi:hypothetical protein
MTDPNVDKLTPPPSLVRQWESSCSPYDPPCDHIAIQAARWGADQELEACCKWVENWLPNFSGGAAEELLRSARRPKPPSLKEQALAALKRQSTRSIPSSVAAEDCDTIRRALEALPND